MKAPISEKAAKLLNNPNTARKLATAIRQAKAKGLPRATVYLDEGEQQALGLSEALTAAPRRKD